MFQNYCFHFKWQAKQSNNVNGKLGLNSTKPNAEYPSDCNKTLNLLIHSDKCSQFYNFAV